MASQKPNYPSVLYFGGLRYTSCIVQWMPKTMRLYIELSLRQPDIVRDFLPHEQILIQDKYRVKAEYSVYFPSLSCYSGLTHLV